MPQNPVHTLFIPALKQKLDLQLNGLCGGPSGTTAPLGGIIEAFLQRRAGHHQGPWHKRFSVSLWKHLLLNSYLRNHSSPHTHTQL